MMIALLIVAVVLLAYYLLNVTLCVAAGWLLGASIVYWLNRPS